MIWNVLNWLGTVIGVVDAPDKESAREAARQMRGGRDAELQRPCIRRECQRTDREKHVLGDRER